MLHLLVAVDGSAHSDAAVGWAALVGGREALLRCTLLNVQKPILVGEVGVIAPVSVAQGERHRSAADILAHAAAQMRDRGIPYEVEERMDDAPTTIISRAEALGCDAIVIGRRGQGAVSAALLGSVSAEVVRRSDIPVVIVAAACSEAPIVPLRVLLAVDGSESALRATTFVSRLAKWCGGEVHLLHVEPGLTVAGYLLGSRDKVVEDWSGKRTQDALIPARSVLERAGVNTTEHVVASSEPHRAIVAAATDESCTTIAMGTRGLSPLTGMLMGSVAQNVLQEVPSTVAAVVLVR
jgi:nucleotide-binding universal stress UspA family protein